MPALLSTAYAYACKDSVTGKSAGIVEFGNAPGVSFKGHTFPQQVDSRRSEWHGKASTTFSYMGPSASILEMHMVDDVKGVYVSAFGDEYVCNKMIR